MAKKGKKSSSTKTKVEANVHKKDKRKNIFTAELQGFVKEDEANPKKNTLFPRPVF